MSVFTCGVFFILNCQTYFECCYCFWSKHVYVLIPCFHPSSVGSMPMSKHGFFLYVVASSVLTSPCFCSSHVWLFSSVDKIIHRGSPDITEARSKEAHKRHSPDISKRSSPDIVEIRRKDVHKRGSPDIVELRRQEQHVRDSPDRRAMSSHLRNSFHVGETPSKLPISKRQGKNPSIPYFYIVSGILAT